MGDGRGMDGYTYLFFTSQKNISASFGLQVPVTDVVHFPC